MNLHQYPKLSTGPVLWFLCERCTSKQLRYLEGLGPGILSKEPFFGKLISTGDPKEAPVSGGKHPIVTFGYLWEIDIFAIKLKLRE